MGYGFATTLPPEKKTGAQWNPLKFLYGFVGNVAGLLDAAFRLSLIRKLTGYVILRPLFISTLSTGLYFVLRYTAYETLRDRVDHPQPIVVVSGIATFMLVFRTNLAYQRYWVARIGVHRAYSGWSDFVIHAVFMYRQRHDWPDKNSAPGLSEKVMAFENDLVHHVSLLFALVLQVLRGDYNVKHVMDFDRRAAEQMFLKEVRNIWMKRPSAGSILESFKLIFSARKHAILLRKYNKRFKVFALGGLSDAEKEYYSSPLLGQAPRSTPDKTPPIRGFDKHGETFEVSAGRVPRGQMFLAYSQVKQFYVKHFPGGERELDNLLLQGYEGYQTASMVVDSAFPLLWDAALTMTILSTVFLLPVLVVRYCPLVPLGAVLNFMTVLSYILVQDVAMAMENPFTLNAGSFLVASLSFLFIDRLLYALSFPMLPTNDIRAHPEMVAMRARYASFGVVDSSQRSHPIGGVSLGQPPPHIDALNIEAGPSIQPSVSEDEGADEDQQLEEYVQYMHP